MKSICGADCNNCGYGKNNKCKGCTACAKACPNGAITGKLKEAHAINRDKCIKCGSCMEKCRFGAIYKD